MSSVGAGASTVVDGLSGGWAAMLAAGLPADLHGDLLVTPLAASWLACTAAALLAFDQLHILLSRVVLTDAAFSFWFILALATITVAVDRRDFRLAILAGVAAVDAATTRRHLGLLRSLPNYDCSRSLETYLFAILRNKLHDHFRRVSKAQRQSLDQLELDDAPSAWLDTETPSHYVAKQEGVVARRQALIRLQRSLERLPGVALVVGPAQQPLNAELGAVYSRSFPITSSGVSSSRRSSLMRSMSARPEACSKAWPSRSSTSASSASMIGK